MDVYNIYFQRFSYDGSSYTAGTFFNPQTENNVYCRSISMSPMQEMKELATLDWPGMDGTDVYVPGEITGNGRPRRKSYDIEISFIWEGSDELWRSVMGTMITYMRGGRLAYYDEYSKIGRKDLTMKRYETESLFRNDTDSTSIMCMKFTFAVNDPVTDVSCVTNSQGTVIRLTWQNL